ncbi:glutamine--tRNA ligase/YqeY domain fusion protein [Haloplasma contractile]|uniref:Glutamine--tRNA ligase n=1 Tax=Haloplasma contractile SSD-17B TaxID=1033810 RepID=U2FKS4_9MOLU|nr:glutamine--tRNA ligase/YqeY domain fusion protein [Haloplasma contractile]ERJ13390.1 Glutamine--tRNA ligase protein [Haloplasma contractile SSD-17B]
MEHTSNFIKTIMKKDLESGKHDEIITRFPPEPNGYLHIGHVRAILTNFELAKEFGGKTNLRFDDTNPLKEDESYVHAIKNDIEWLGYKWNDLFYASNYFDIMFEKAIVLIKKGVAYVDDQSADEIRENRGTLTEPGKVSPYRDRTVGENLDLFERMKKGEFEDGSKVLRAKIDMASPNINLRDPVLYRVSHVTHHNTGDKWCIYPMYDYAHPIEDAIEAITHSLCTLEFEAHRPLYDWVVRECEMKHTPRQIEFAKLRLTDTVLSKRNLVKLVEDGVIDGFDDPRIASISGLRRRGYTSESLKQFVRETGLSKSESGKVDFRMLEHFIRQDLKLKANRTMSVIDPLKVVITNYPEGEHEYLPATNNPENEELGKREIPFSREIYIEREDFMENPPKKYRRLYPGNEVRLKHAYFIKCTDFIKDEDGNVVEIRATYDPETKSGTGFTGRKVKGTIHWVDASHNVPAEFRLYDHLVLDDEANEDKPFSERVNPNSLHVYNGFLEENMKGIKPYDKFQFYRHGYFSVDPNDTTESNLVINRIVSLKSSFKINK